MRYFISQIIAFLLSPLVWMLLLAVWQYFLKEGRRRTICRWSVVIIFFLFSNQWLLDNYARAWQPAPVELAAGTVYSCGILLGGYGSADVQTNGGYFNKSADRFIQALKLYKTGKIKTLLITGGNGKKETNQFSESSWTRQLLQQMGVPDSVILFEDQSANTAENAANSKKLLESAGLQAPYVLVTSAYHMPRASLIYNNAGLKHVIYPCNYTAGKGRFSIWDLFPDPSIMHEWNTFLKEAVGYFIYRIKG